MIQFSEIFYIKKNSIPLLGMEFRPQWLLCGYKFITQSSSNGHGENQSCKNHHCEERRTYLRNRTDHGNCSYTYGKFPMANERHWNRHLHCTYQDWQEPCGRGNNRVFRMTFLFLLCFLFLVCCLCLYYTVYF